MRTFRRAPKTLFYVGVIKPHAPTMTRMDAREDMHEDARQSARQSALGPSVEAILRARARTCNRDCHDSDGCASCAFKSARAHAHQDAIRNAHAYARVHRLARDTRVGVRYIYSGGIVKRFLSDAAALEYAHRANMAWASCGGGPFEPGDLPYDVVQS